MKTTSLDKFGYISKSQFIDLHEKILPLLKKKFHEIGEVECFENEIINKKNKEKHEIASLPAWIYGKNKASVPEGEKSKNKLPTIETLYRSHPVVRDFLEKYRSQLIKEEKSLNINRLNFGLIIYDMKRAFFPRNIADIKPFFKISKTHYLYGVFLLLEENLEIEDLNSFTVLNTKNYWTKEESTIDSPFNKNKNLVINAESDWTFYLGFYFSIAEFRVKNFILSIAYDLNKNKYDCREWGFHNIGGKYEEEDWEYDGDAYIKDGILYINLTGKNDGKQLNIIGAVDKSKKEAFIQPIIRAAIQGISKDSESRILSAEVLFYKIPEDKSEVIVADKKRDPVKAEILSEVDFTTLGLYLMLHRNMHGIRHHQVSKISELMARGKIAANYQYLVGTYRIWNFGLEGHGKIIQSKFVVRGDGTGILTPFVDTKKGKKTEQSFKERMSTQSCIININKTFSTPKIWVVSFTKPGLNITNVALFDYPEYKEEKVIEGTFSSVGYNREGIISGYAVMTKEDNQDNHFEPMEMPLEEAWKYAKKNYLHVLYNKLYYLYKKKSWPQGKGRQAFLKKLKSLGNQDNPL